VSRRLPLLALLLALGPAPTRAAFEVEALHEGPDRPHLLLAPRPAETATLVVRFPVGSVDDGGLSGLTRLTQQALLAANQRVDLPALLLDLHAAAATLRVETGLRSCQFVLTAHRDAFPPLAHRLLEALLAPHLVPAALPRAAARAVHEALPERAEDALVALVAATALSDGRYRNRPEGDRQIIETLGPDDVADHLEHHFAPAEATVVLAGAFRRDEALKVARRFRGGAARPVVRPTLTVPVRTSFRGSREINVVAYPLALRGPRDAATARLLTALVEGELWRTFRDAGAGYAFLVSTVPAPWQDLLLVTLPATDPSRLDLRPHLRQALERVRSGRLDEATVARERAVALAALRAEDEAPEPLARALADGGEAWHGAAVAQALAAPGAPGLADLSSWLDPAAAVEITFGGRRP
jgi:predicted Zn-dependent peptidase